MIRPLLAAVVLAMAPVPWLAGSASAQQSFGRLFYTPAQRAQLDAARRLPPVAERAPEADRPPPAAPAPQTLSVEGIVRRNDGRTTVWVNRIPTPAPQQRGALRIGPVGDPADGADLRLPESGQRARVKVGQEIDMSSGRVQERYRLAPATGQNPADLSAPRAPQAAPAMPAPPGRAKDDDNASGAGSADARRSGVAREAGRRVDTPAPSQDAVR